MTRFEIDLLMGAGLPPKIHPIKYVLSSIPLLVIMLVAILLLAQYYRDKVTMKAHKIQLQALERKITSHADDVAYRSAVNADVQRAQAYLKEATSGLKKQTQFTPIMVAVAEELPDNMVLSKFSVERNDIRKKVPDPNNRHRTTSKMLVGRTIRMVVCDVTSEESGSPIQDFMNALETSDGLGPLIDDIRMDRRREDRLSGHDVVSYKIDCDLKPEE